MSNPDAINPAQTSSAAREAARQATTTLSLAERRARALAPTIFCPASRVEQCLSQAAQSGVNQ